MGGQVVVNYFLMFTFTAWIMFTRADDCVKVGPCSCTFSDSHIDLSPIVSGPGPLFKDQYDSQYNSQYSYNPCIAFTESSCSNVAVCQSHFGSYFSCGTQESAIFKYDSSSKLVTIQYASTDQGVTRTSLVTLKCTKDSASNMLIATGESPTQVYNFELQSKYACEQPGGLSVAISVGSILLIIFFSVLCVYLIAGILFQKLGRKAVGSEIVPNHSFWFSLPSLLKDGTFFVLTHCAIERCTDLLTSHTLNLHTTHTHTERTNHIKAFITKRFNTIL
ncbi:Cation-dependent mannose-6-phosphate receptor [Bulinus truncatus]|nr:Cation-dependent mannose-6-phosphate receptor [Bulinus truncatus]